MPRARSKRILGIPDEFWIAFVIMIGFFLKIVYDTKIGWNNGTVSLGVWQAIGSNSPSGGHLSVIQHYYTNFFVLKVNPREYSCFTNPPLYYLLSALILHFFTDLMKWNIGFALGCLQCVNVIYVMVGSCAGIGIVQKFGVRGRKLVTAVLFLMFFPTLYNLGAAMDGSAMSFMFMMLALNSILGWYDSRRFRTLRKTAVYVGLGMMTSYGTVIVLPAAAYLIMKASKDGRRNDTPIQEQFKIACVIAGVCTFLWPIYLLIRFRIPLFFVTPPMGMTINASFSDRFALPGHTVLTHLSTAGTDPLEINLWGQAFKTAVVDFNALNLKLRGVHVMAVILLYLVIFIFVLQQLMFIYILLTARIEHVHAGFLLIGEVSILIGYVIAAIRYPYVGTMDFKAIAPILIFPLTGTCLIGSELNVGIFETGAAKLQGWLVLIMSFLTAFLYGFYY